MRMLAPATDKYVCDGVKRFNRRNHKFISAVLQDSYGNYVIEGRTGRRLYMGYTWRGAVAMYNALCRQEGVSPYRF